MDTYSVTSSDTNTAGTTQQGVHGGTTVRPVIFFLCLGSAATPADQACEYFLGRTTTLGTKTAFTPHPMNGAPAAIATAGFNYTAEPTYTANEVLLRFAKNQRSPWSFQTLPQYGFTIPATANAGICLLSNAVTSAYAEAVTTHFTE